ncbi:MAG: HIT family protein [Candidatus Aenigmatarchaeota archaeon]
MDCVFCKIVKGEIPCHRVYEDDEFFAFFDINPLNPGHTLLIPKKHVQWVNDYEPFCSYWQTARKVANVIQKVLDPLVVSYVVYGLGVPHAHIHLIPKFENDEHPLGPNPEKVQKIPEEEMKKIAEKIRKSFK